MQVVQAFGNVLWKSSTADHIYVRYFIDGSMTCVWICNVYCIAYLCNSLYIDIFYDVLSALDRFGPPSQHVKYVGKPWQTQATMGRSWVLGTDFHLLFKGVSKFWDVLVLSADCRQGLHAPRKSQHHLWKDINISIYNKCWFLSGEES